MSRIGVRASRRSAIPLAFVGTLLVSGLLVASAGRSIGPTVVDVDVTPTGETLNTQLATQFHYPGALDRAPGTRDLFATFGAPMVRILAAADGCCWEGGPPPMLPAGRVRGDWNFSALDSVVNDITAVGALPVLDVFQAPEWMWDCRTGRIRDATFSEFADYMARLVAYYNLGSFTAEDGRQILNPAGTSNRITFWEIWNEPDWWSIACPPNGNTNITAREYLTMWNATVPKMLAVDATIKLVGPCVANASGNASGNYIALLLAAATRKPDVISFHGYGNWQNSASDKALFGGGCCGIDAIEANLESIRLMAGEIPIWITELNVNADWGDDPAARPINAYGVAWGASAFRRLALAGAGALFQFEFGTTGNANFQLVDPATGKVRLSYWRDYYLARYFPPGSTVVSSRSSSAGIETLAVRPPGSRNVNVLVVNRQVENGSIRGGPGVPASVSIKVTNLAGITGVTLRQLDSATPVETGPSATALAIGDTATVRFPGHGAALLEFVTTSPTVAAPVRRQAIPASAGFADDFESPTIAWTAVTGQGRAATETSVAHGGKRALSLSNGSGQSVWLTKDLARALEASITTFYLRPTAETAGFVAWGRDVTSMSARWALLYIPADRSVTLFLYDDAGRATELRGGAGTVPLDKWTKVELRHSATTDGGAELLLDDVLRASVHGDYASARPYRLFQLANETAGSTTFYDDVRVDTR